MLLSFSLEMAKQNLPSLAEVVKEVAEQQHIQASEIEKSKTVLAQLQVIRSYIDLICVSY